MRRLLADQRGQLLPLLAAGLAVVLLGLTAFVVDVGHALVVQRQLQAGADAAALAGAQQLPDAVSAAATAKSYAADPANASGAQSVATTVTTRCLKTTTPCTGSTLDVVSVEERASVAMTFARFLGVDALNVTAKSTAAQTVSTKPLDVVLVLDRTGSMSSQMSNLRAAASAFLDALDPAYTRVALVVLPPLPPSGGACSAEKCDYYPVGNGRYVVEHLTSDFTRLKSDVNSLTSAGSTAYKQALVAASTELQANGRAGAAKAIVFETDGAANAVPDDAYQQPTSWLDLGSQSIPYGWPATGRLGDIQRPCGSAADYAASLGLPVYTVGFHLSQDKTCYQAPYRAWQGTTGYKDVVESGIDSTGALQQMAQRSGGRAFLQEDGSKLAETFAAVATQLQPARLVRDDS